MDEAEIKRETEREQRDREFWIAMFTDPKQGQARGSALEENPELAAVLGNRGGVERW